MSDCVDLVLDARLWLCACAAGQLPTSRVGILCRDRWGTIASELNAPDETRYSPGPQGRSTAIVLCTPQSLLGIVKRPWRTGVPTRLRIDHRQFGSIPRHARRLALVAVVPMVPAIGAPSDVPSPRWAVYSPRSDPPLCLAAAMPPTMSALTYWARRTPPRALQSSQRQAGRSHACGRSRSALDSPATIHNAAIECRRLCAMVMLRADARKRLAHATVDDRRPWQPSSTIARATSRAAHVVPVPARNSSRSSSESD